MIKLIVIHTSSRLEGERSAVTPPQVSSITSRRRDMAPVAASHAASVVSTPAPNRARSTDSPAPASGVSGGTGLTGLTGDGGDCCTDRVHSILSL